MGLKVDREAVATLVLPQLWAMSIGPCRCIFTLLLHFSKYVTGIVLNVEQFQRFMAVIRKLSDRVEREHNQFLRDSQRIEDRSATAANVANGGQTSRGGIDFETLVGGAGAATIKADTELTLNWEDDVWGSILSSGAVVCFFFSSDPEMRMLIFCSIQQNTSQTPSVSQTAAPPIAATQSTQSLPSSPRISGPGSLGGASSKPSATRISAGSHVLMATSIPSPSPVSSSFTPSLSSHLSPPTTQSSQPGHLRSTITLPNPPQTQKPVLPKPNYNVSLSDIFTNTNQQPPLVMSSMSPPNPSNPSNQPHAPMSGTFSAPAVTPFAPPAVASRPAMDILTPLKPRQSSLSGLSTKKPTSKDIWNDFDPLA